MLALHFCTLLGAVGAYISVLVYVSEGLLLWVIYTTASGVILVARYYLRKYAIRNLYQDDGLRSGLEMFGMLFQRITLRRN